MHDTSEEGERSFDDSEDLIDDPYVVGPLRAAVTPSRRADPKVTTPRSPRSGRSILVNVALLLALVFSWGTGLFLLFQRVVLPAIRPSFVAARPRRSPEPQPRVALRPPARGAARGSTVGKRVPQATTTVEVGAVTVVDVGVGARSLADELSRQRAAAQDAHQTMVVMATIADCGPCASVVDALLDPQMQTALSRVRLVRVFAEVFRDDLDGLQIPREHFPGFFVLGPDLRPRDGIDGGEWDDDVPENMAPVLQAFVRGTLTKRRTPWQALPGSGMRL